MGTLFRLVVIVALVAAAVVVPLFLVHRATGCRGSGGEPAARWSFGLPPDEPPARCRRTQTGFEVMKDYVGLE